MSENEVMNISIKDRFMEQFDRLWEQVEKEHPECELVTNGYDVVDHIFKNSMMLVGLNPSIGEGDRPAKFFESLNSNSYPRYYRPIFDFARECGFENNFSYADLFAIRCSSQRRIITAMSKAQWFKDFCIAQFCLCKKILELASPSIIVVANAYARLWFQKASGCLNEMPFSMEMDHAIGTYRIKDDSPLNNVPVFFSGMLSGQHSLDVGSRERLIWHIKKIISKETAETLERE